MPPKKTVNSPKRSPKKLDTIDKFDPEIDVSMYTVKNLKDLAYEYDISVGKLKKEEIYNKLVIVHRKKNPIPTSPLSTNVSDNLFSNDIPRPSTPVDIDQNDNSSTENKYNSPYSDTKKDSPIANIIIKKYDDIDNSSPNTSHYINENNTKDNNDNDNNDNNHNNDNSDNNDNNHNNDNSDNNDNNHNNDNSDNNDNNDNSDNNDIDNNNNNDTILKYEELKNNKENQEVINITICSEDVHTVENNICNEDVCIVENNIYDEDVCIVENKICNEDVCIVENKVCNEDVCIVETKNRDKDVYNVENKINNIDKQNEIKNGNSFNVIVKYQKKKQKTARMSDQDFISIPKYNQKEAVNEANNVLIKLKDHPSIKRFNIKVVKCYSSFNMDIDTNNEPLCIYKGDNKSKRVIKLVGYED